MVLENHWKTVFIQVKIKLTIGYQKHSLQQNRKEQSKLPCKKVSIPQTKKGFDKKKKKQSSFVFLVGEVFPYSSRLYLPGHCYKLFLFFPFTWMFNTIFPLGHPRASLPNAPSSITPPDLSPWSGTGTLHTAVLPKPWRPMLCHSFSRAILLPLLKAFCGTYCIGFNMKSIPHNAIHISQGQKKS